MGTDQQNVSGNQADLFTWANTVNLDLATDRDQLSKSDRIAVDFAEWKQQFGSRHVLRDLHAMAAGFYRDYQRYGLRVSMKYLYEIERHRVRTVRKRLQHMGGDLHKWNGYRLNNDFTALIARHIIDKHPEWDGMFEFRERRAA